MSSWDTRPTAVIDECVQAEQLVPGDADGMRAVAVRLRRVAVGAEQLRELLCRVNAGEWVGESGTAFRQAVERVPAPYGVAGEAFGDAARALEHLANAISDGRDVARVQLTRWQDAEIVSSRWRHEQAEWQASGRDWAAHLALTGRASPPCTDPGEWARADAVRVLAQVQADIEEAAQRAARTIADAASRAPRSNEWGSVVEGLKQGVTGPMALAWGLTPMSGRAGETWRGVLGSVTDPAGAAKQAWRAFADDPVLFLASAVPAAIAAGPKVVRQAPGRRAEPLPELSYDAVADLGGTKRLQRPELAPVRPATWYRENSTKIADHAWQKHAVDGAEFPWVKDVDDLADYVTGVMRQPSESFTGLPGRGLYWDEERRVIVIQQDPPHSGSVFTTSKRYYEDEVSKAMKRLAKLRQQEGDEHE